MMEPVSVATTAKARLCLFFNGIVLSLEDCWENPRTMSQKLYLLHVRQEGWTKVQQVAVHEV